MFFSSSLRLLGLAVALCAMGQVASANLITSTTGSNTVTSGGTGTLSVNNTTHTITVNLNATSIDNAHDIALRVNTSSAGHTAGYSEIYHVVVNLTNAETHHHAINGYGVTPSTTGIAASAGPATAGDTDTGGTTAVSPTSNTFSPITYDANTAGDLYFGHVSDGGGNSLAFGSTSQETFDILVVVTSANKTGTLTLTFTANPEPGSMALAGLAFSGLGGMWWRRRRQQQVVAA